MLTSAPTSGVIPRRVQARVEARRPVDAVGVHEGEGRLAEGGGPLGQRLGQGGGFEKAECALGVQLDEHGLVVDGFEAPASVDPWDELDQHVLGVLRWCSR